jgi:hypothetical protein
VVFVHARVRPKDSSEWQEVRLADVYTFRGNQAVQMRAFADRQDVGLAQTDRVADLFEARPAPSQPRFTASGDVT